MILLQEAIGGGPFFILALFLLVAGFASLLYTLFRVTKSVNKKQPGNEEQIWESRNKNKGLLVVLIIILAGLIFFINWLSKIKYG